MGAETGFATAREQDGMDIQAAASGVGVDARARHAAAGEKELSPGLEEQAMSDDVLHRVRAALGRTGPTTAPPPPPEIDLAITRCVEETDDLTALFMKMCRHNKMGVEQTLAGELPARLADLLRRQNMRRVALSDGGTLERVGLQAALQREGFEAVNWSEMSLDQLYDFDCGVTDVDRAVAETGSLVVRARTGHGRGLSLVPPLHVAVVETTRIIADLVDLFAWLGSEGVGTATTLITGPSKTSDIEMNLVVGVHGPMQVQVFLID
jgi:L-lactate dehydrogenase complex protein LldG